jgi:phosphoribosylanthranilate isomerase
VTVRTRIKFCGMTTPEEIALAVEAGADAVGAILAPSARRVSREALPALARAVPPFVSKVAVVVDASDDDLRAARDLGFTLQFSGGESAERCEAAAQNAPYVKVVHVAAGEEFDAARLAALDAYRGALLQFETKVAGSAGGTGASFDWTVVESLSRRRPVAISGGLTPANVGACVASARPYAVDVRSGVETNGMKDPRKMRAFVDAVRAADAQA